MTLREGFWRRMVAGLIDTWLMSLIFGVVLGPLTFVGFMTYTACVFGHPAIMFAVLGVTILATLLAPAAYYAGFESSRWQSTPGKRMVGLKVTDLEGGKPRYWQSFVKTIVQEIFYAIFTTGLLFIATAGIQYTAKFSNGSLEVVDITPVLLALVLSQVLFASLFLAPWFREHSQTLADKWTFRAVVPTKERLEVYTDPSVKAGPLGAGGAFWHSPVLSMAIMLVVVLLFQLLFWFSDCYKAVPVLSFLHDSRLLWVTSGLLSIITVYGSIALFQEIFLHIYMQGLNAGKYVKTAKFLSSISIGLKRDLYADFARGITRAYEGNSAEAFRLIEQWEKRIYVTPMYYATAVFASLLLDDDDHIASFSQEAIRKLPRQCDYYRVQIAHVQFRRRRFADGIAMLEQISPPKSKTGVVVMQMAFLACFARVGALDELNRTEELINSYRKDLISDFIHKYYQGIALAARGEYQKAREQLDEASRMIPESILLRNVSRSLRAGNQKAPSAQVLICPSR